MINPARDSIEMQRLLAMILAEKEKKEEEKRRARGLLDPFREDMANMFDSPLLDPIKRDFGATFSGGEEEAPEDKKAIFMQRLAELQKAQSGGDPEGPSFAARLQPHSLDESMYVPDAVEPSYPQEGGFKQEDMWAEFQRMNPNLNYAKVAQQAGGNVPGGNFSAMESNIKEMTPGASDEEFNQSINELRQRQQEDALLDPRSRSYNPDAAKVIFDRAGEKESNAADMIFNRAQELQSKAAAAQSAMVVEQYRASRTPEGQLNSMIEMVLQNVDSMMNAPLYQRAIDARRLLSQGKLEEAWKIFEQVVPKEEPAKDGKGKKKLKSDGKSIG